MESSIGSKLSWNASDLESLLAASARESTVDDFYNETNIAPKWLKGKAELTADFPKTLAEKIKETKFHSLVAENQPEPGGFWEKHHAADEDGGEKEARDAAEKAAELQAKLKAELAAPTTALIAAYVHARLLKVLGGIAVKMRRQLKCELPRTHRASSSKKSVSSSRWPFCHCRSVTE